MSSLVALFPDVDGYVQSFEAARRQGPARIQDHLPPLNAANRLPVLVELIRVEIEHAADQGRKKRLADYTFDFPELLDEPEAIAEIRFELGRQSPDEADPDLDDLPATHVVTVARPSRHRLTGTGTLTADTNAFQVYRNQIGDSPVADKPRVDGLAAAVFADLHAARPALAAQVAEAVASFPEVGTVFSEFHLVEVLGSGAFGRVYLARQTGLADRLVALKVAVDLTGEPQTLARLQHTNIVPIHSLHTVGPFQAVCMPYFGAMTLADVMGRLSESQTLPGSGSHFVSTIQNHRASTKRGSRGDLSIPHPLAIPLPLSPTDRSGPTQEYLNQLNKLSYTDAVLWLGARLADGLGHAHGRGIIHRDLKPANVLLTDEGQPMLLDFNLADNASARVPASAARIGGTLPYMAPEHLEAYQTRKPGGIDARSDLYSLGIMLFELLAGKHPFPNPSGKIDAVLTRMIADRSVAPPRIRDRNPNVSPAAEAIVRKCLDPNPAYRYQSARQLQEDLEHQLANRPLCYAAEPSVRERCVKWVRRNPWCRSTGAVAILSFLIMLSLGGAVWAARDQIATQREELANREARSRFEEFRKQKRELELRLGAGQTTADDIPIAVAAARQTLAPYGLPEDGDWHQRPAVIRLTQKEQQELQNAAGELCYLTARTLDYSAQRATPPNPQLAAEAGEWSRVALDCVKRFGADHPVYARYLELTEKLSGFKSSRKSPALVRDQVSAQAAYYESLDLYNRERFTEALPRALFSTQQRPTHLPSWLVVARCYAELGRYLEAKGAFDVSIALAPDLYLTHYHRGRFRTRIRAFGLAMEDFNTAIRLSPKSAEPVIGRALAREGLRDFAGMLADLNEALKLGAPRHSILMYRSRAFAGLSLDRESTLDREEFLRSEPSNVARWLERVSFQMSAEPNAALNDLEKALAERPENEALLLLKARILEERLGRSGEAIQILDHLVKRSPESARLRTRRGLYHARAGDREMAIADVGTGFALDQSPIIRYEIAKIYTAFRPMLGSDENQTLDLLMSVIGSGYGGQMGLDPAFEPIRTLPRFQRILQAMEARTDISQIGPRIP